MKKVISWIVTLAILSITSVAYSGPKELKVDGAEEYNLRLEVDDIRRESKLVREALLALIQVSHQLDVIHDKAIQDLYKKHGGKKI